MKNMDYLFKYHMLWNPELKYMYDHRNDNERMHFQFFLHICNYWTLEEIVYFYKKMDVTFDYFKRVYYPYFFYIDKKEILFRNNNFYFKIMNDVLKELGLPEVKELIERDDKIENKKKQEQKLLEKVNNILDILRKEEIKKNNAIIKNYFRKKFKRNFYLIKIGKLEKFHDDLAKKKFKLFLTNL